MEIYQQHLALWVFLICAFIADQLQLSGFNITPLLDCTLPMVSKWLERQHWLET